MNNRLRNIITAVIFLCEMKNFLKKISPEASIVNKKPKIAVIADEKTNPLPGSKYPTKKMFSPSPGVLVS